VNEDIARIFVAFLYILMIAIVIRALMSWFPIDRNNQFSRILYTVTEPILDPIRRIMPRLGMIDLSAMVAIILLWVMIAVVQQAANS
jgi:YggT family protein